MLDRYLGCGHAAQLALAVGRGSAPLRPLLLVLVLLLLLAFCSWHLRQLHPAARRQCKVMLPAVKLDRGAGRGSCCWASICIRQRAATAGAWLHLLNLVEAAGHVLHTNAKTHGSFAGSRDEGSPNRGLNSAHPRDRRHEQASRGVRHSSLLHSAEKMQVSQPACPCLSSPLSARAVMCCHLISQHTA